MTTQPITILSGNYKQWEGYWTRGSCPVVLPPNPTAAEKQLLVVTATEGGRWDAINMYDRMIVSVGAIQWGEASMYGVSDMLGLVQLRDPELLAPLKEPMHLSNGAYGRNEKNRFRFFEAGNNEVDTLVEQQQQFLLHSTGLKGSWDPESSAHAKAWLRGLSQVFQQPEAQRIQAEYTTSRLMGFMTKAARDILVVDNPSKWGRMILAAYISYAANLPAVASEQLTIAAKTTKYPFGSEGWCIDVLKQLTFGAGIGIYPHRYNAIRPVLERLYGVDLPDLATDLGWKPPELVAQFALHTPKGIQEALLALGYDLGPQGADGKIGAKTTSALLTFQQLNGLKVDGVAGPQTTNALARAMAAHTGG